MPFFNIWNRVLHVVVHMLLTQVTRAQTSQIQAIPVFVCGQSAYTKWKTCGGRWSGSVLRHWGYRCSWQPEPFLLSYLPQGRFGVDAWPTWSLGTFSGCHEFCPWPATKTGDTWLAGSGFWGKPLQWKWAGAPKEAHSSWSSGHSGSRVSLCRASNCGPIWSSGCHVASPCQGVVADWSAAIGWPLWAGLPTVVPTHIVCQPSEHWGNMVSRRGVGW